MTSLSLYPLSMMSLVTPLISAIITCESSLLFSKPAILENKLHVSLLLFTFTVFALSRHPLMDSGPLNSKSQGKCSGCHSNRNKLEFPI
jgi:hypothetical protein